MNKRTRHQILSLLVLILMAIPLFSLSAQQSDSGTVTPAGLNAENVGWLSQLAFRESGSFNDNASALIYRDESTRNLTLENFVTGETTDLNETISGDLIYAGFPQGCCDDVLLIMLDGGAMRLLNVHTLAEIGGWYADDAPGWDMIYPSRDGGHLITSDGEQVVVWERATGAAGFSIQARASFVTLSPDMQYALWLTEDEATGSESVHIAEIATAQEILTYDRPEGTLGFIFSPDSRYIAHVRNGGLHVVEVATGAAALVTETSHDSASVTGWGSNTHFVMHIAEQTTVYDVAAGEVALQHNAEDSDRAWLSPDFRVSVHFDERTGTVSVWDMAADTQYSFNPGYNDRYVRPYWSDGVRVLLKGPRDTDSEMRVYDATTGSLTHTLTGLDSSLMVADASPDGRLMAGVNFGGDLVVWSLDDSGRVLHYLYDTLPLDWSYSNTLRRFRFTPDGASVLMTYRDDRGTTSRVVWGLPAAYRTLTDTRTDNRGNAATAESALAVSGLTQPQAAVVTLEAFTSMGFDAIMTPGTDETCRVPDVSRLLAVARGADGSVLAYTPGPACEGAVWIPAERVERLNWLDSDSSLDDLLQLDITLAAPESAELPPPLETLPGHEAFCETLSGWGNAPGAASYNVFAPPQYREDWQIPAEWLAVSISQVEIVVCAELVEVVYGSCPYTTGGSETYYVRRVRQDLQVSLVNYADGRIFAQETYQGDPPMACPQTVSTLNDINGWRPDYEVATNWILARLSGSEAIAVTHVSTGSLNARAEPGTNAAIIAQLPQGTHVNVFARNEAGDWVVALTPDMQKVWLYTSLLTLSAQVELDQLPIVTGAAADVPLYILP